MAAFAQDVRHPTHIYQFKHPVRFGSAPNAIGQVPRKLAGAYQDALKHPKADSAKQRCLQEKRELRKVARITEVNLNSDMLNLWLEHEFIPKQSTGSILGMSNAKHNKGQILKND